LQYAALNNDVQDVLRLVASASDDDQGHAALLVLADFARADQPGQEGRNVISTLLQAIARSGVELGASADPIADAVASHLRRAELAPHDLLGALMLSRACSRAVGPELLATVLRHEAAEAQLEVALGLIDRSADVPDELRARLARVAAAAVLVEPGQAADHLRTVPVDAMQRVLRDVASELKPRSDRHYTAANAADGTEADAKAILKPAPHEVLLAMLDALQLDPTAHSDPAIDDHREAVEIELVRLMLELNRTELRNALAGRLAGLAPIADHDLVERLLAATARRTPSDWNAWLGAVDLNVIRADDELQQEIDRLASKLWDLIAGEKPPSDEATLSAIDALARFSESVAPGTVLEQAVRTSLEDPVTSEDELESAQRLLSWAARLEQAGRISAASLADIDLDQVAATLETSIPLLPDTLQTDIGEALIERMRHSAKHATARALELVSEAAASEAWLSEKGCSWIRMRAAIAPCAPSGLAVSPLSTEALRAYSDHLASGSDGTLSVEIIAWWLDRFANAPDDVWNVVGPLSEHELPERISDALGTMTERLAERDHVRLIELALDRINSNPVARSYYQAIRLAEAPPDNVATLLENQFREARNKTAYKATLEAWSELSLTSDAVQRRLLDAIYLPLLARGQA
jgi:hypothetical protein